jgi:hypothetical protein
MVSADVLAPLSAVALLRSVHALIMVADDLAALPTSVTRRRMPFLRSFTSSHSTISRGLTTSENSDQSHADEHRQ